MACRIDAVGVLADHLEETGHKLAQKVRKRYEKWLRCTTAFRSGEWKPRRANSRWEEVALWHRHLRHLVLEAFGRSHDAYPDLHKIRKANHRSFGPVPQEETCP